jgi:hypothetical protein
MKDILIKYPIKILQQELINIRTRYKLEKEKINDILKTMKSIRKLSKEDLIDLLIKYNYDISKLPKLEELEKKRGRPAKPKVEKEQPKFLYTTDEERQLKKELGNLIKPKLIYNIDYFIDKIDNSGDSKSTKKTKVKEELALLKDYYDDRQQKREETRNKETTNAKLDIFLKYQKERINKLEEYLKKI